MTITLETVKDLHTCFKPGQSQAIAVAIINCALDHGGLWPDDIDWASVRHEDKNVIGGTFSRLCRAGLIQRNPHHQRKSKAPDAHGRFICYYSLGNRGLAETFLRRNHQHPVSQQLELNTP